MAGLTLLERAAKLGLTVRLDGDDLVIRGPGSCGDLAAEILGHKPEVIKALRSQAAPDPASWEVLSQQRWGTDPAPGIEVPADWRSEVAGWPMDRWQAWHHRAFELEAEEVDPTTGPAERAQGIRRAQERAYREIAAQDGGTNR